MTSVSNKKEIIRLIETLKINGCAICGSMPGSRYLHFHHVEQSEKSFNLHGSNLLNKNDSDIIQEIHKCILLCNKCHGTYTRIEIKGSL